MQKQLAGNSCLEVQHTQRQHVALCIAPLAMLTLCTARAMAQYRVCVQDILYLVGPVLVQLRAWTAGKLHCRDSGSRAYE
jgi:hypothetical protein